MLLNYPIVAEIAYHTYAVNEYGMASFFVLRGKERGLVIDSGCGSFDARALIEKLCPVPYDVVMTHGHGDHIGAACQWEKAWLHPLDFDRVKDVHRMKEMLWENPAIHVKPGSRGFGVKAPSGEVWDYPYTKYAAIDIYDLHEDMFLGFENMPQWLPLEDGQKFDLGGGRVCEIIHTPGHTAGSCSVLDPDTRILFSGDACNINLGISGTSVNTALRGLLKLDTRRGDFDRNFNSHVGAGGDPCCFSMPDSTLDDCIWICRAIMDGTAEIIENAPPKGVKPGAVPPWMLHNGKPPKGASVIHGAVRINFNLNRLLDEGEVPICQG